MSKPAARKPTLSVSGYETSLVRCAVALLLVAVGIAWIAVYSNGPLGIVNYLGDPKTKPDTTFQFMVDLKKWNYVIGFGLMFLGLIVAAHKKTPLGRGRGVVIGMLGCFLIGLAWIVTYYFVAQSASTHIWVMSELGQSNLLVGVGFMAVGFTYATKWE